MESSRKDDTRKSDVISEYLDKYFYPVFVDNEKYVHYRIFSSELQKKGVDYIIESISGFLDYSSRSICYLDEKACLDYGDRIPTQCFEVTTLFVDDNYKQLITGWFMNEELLTTSYLFVFPVWKPYRSVMSSIDDIDYLRVLIVGKKRLQKYLKNMGITKKKYQNRVFICVKNFLKTEQTD